MALKRVIFQLDESLVNDVDNYAKTLHLNRTAAVSVLLSTALSSTKALTAIVDIWEQSRLENINKPAE